MATLMDEPVNRIGLVSRSAVALAYLLLGALGLLLAIPPGFASPVFPAAGFALACALLYGRRVLPSIWLGSMALNLGQMALSGTLAPAPVLTAGVIAAAAALQAALGAWCIDRPELREWRTLASEKVVIRFLLLGGAFACLVSASLSVTALQLAGVVKSDAWLFSWWNWYTGDLIGVVIFAPLTLLALSGRDPLWRERRWRIGVPVVATLMLAMAAFGVAMRWEKQQEQARLSRDGESLARLIRSRLIAHEEILSSLRRFAEATPGFTYRQFEVFTRISLADNPDIFALSFNDLVRGDDLSAHERRVKDLSPLPGYRVTERNERGELVPAQPRDFHVAVRYIIPLQGNLPALGYDINSDPVRRDAIERAREKNGMAVTAPLRLVQENAVRMGVLALQPVHANPQASVQEAGRPIGFAVAVVKVDELIDIATRGHIPAGLVLTVKDASAPPGADTLYVSGGIMPGDVGGQWEAPLAFGGREWRFEVRAQESYLATRRPWMAWAVGVVGLMFSGLLQIYLLGMSGRTATIRRQNEALLANQAGLQLADAVFKNAGEAVMVIDRDGAIVSVNPAFTSITGYGAQDAQGQPLRMLSGGDMQAQLEQLEPAMWQALAERGQWRGERHHQRKDGSTFLAWWTITAIKGDTSAASLYVCTFSDITEQRSAQERVEFLAYHDALTSLPNRVLGRQRALEAIAHARRHGLKLAVLFLDLDHFKLVNDTYGHSVGDQLLQQVASRLRANLRAADCLCRLSGDEFMVILEDVQQSAQVVQVCEKLLAQIARPFELEGRFVQVSVTIGLALFPGDGEDPETLLRHADTALFQAKQAGRNTYRMFDAHMNADVVRFVTVRDELQQALKNGEFELHYQPQVDLADGSVHAVEALIRWNSPSRGLVMPGDFIAVAEESGLIAPIGEWVLQQACLQMADWRARGVHLATVAVNLSAVQLRKPGLAQVLAQSLAQTGLPAGCLELELTESILIHDRANTLAKLEELLAYGVRLSIDDFGTGYSSMAYLKRLKVHKLKIDRSFAADVANDREDAAIVTAIVTMAHSLGLQTVAEGIESPDAQAVLRAMGCDRVQGFLHARPMPAAQFEAWYGQRQAARIAAAGAEPA